MSYRIQRVEKLIEKELATIVQREAHDELLHFVSITKVVLTTDMSLATVWFTVLGSDAELEATSKALEGAKGYLRSELAHRLDLRKAPELRFKYDESIAYGNHIEEILSNLK